MGLTEPTLYPLPLFSSKGGRQGFQKIVDSTTYLHLQLLVVFYNLQQNHHKSTTENISFQCFISTKLHFPFHKLQKYPSYKESVYKLWIFLRVFPQFCEFRDD